MAFTSETHRIAYFPVPKVACTSLKRAIYRIENRRPFKPGAHGGKTIHGIYPTDDFAADVFDRLDGYWSFAVVRDPFKRFVSAYRNKIGEWTRFLEQVPDKPRRMARLAAVGLDTTPPDLPTFCARLDSYRAALPSAKHHTDSFATFLGPDLSRFDRVYLIEELDLLRDDLSARVGRPVRIPHSNTTPESVTVTIDAATYDAIIAHTAADYALLGGRYSPPTKDQIIR